MAAASKKQKRPEGSDWKWVGLQGQRRDQWLAEGYAGGTPPRVKQLDNRTFACYRDGLYLGSEKTLELAQARCVSGKISDRNATMAEWERGHPTELPPGLDLTEAERAEFWRRHPPTAAPAGRIGRPAEGRPNEDPATRRLREQIATDSRPPKVRAGGRDAPDVPQAGLVMVRERAQVPKRPGSAAHTRWTLLWAYHGRPVQEYARAKGSNMTTLANAIARGLVTVEVEDKK